MAFPGRLFAVRASVPALMVPEPKAPGETAKAAPILAALASALVDSPEPDLERLQAAKR
jgi:hypothetical protein